MNGQRRRGLVLWVELVRVARLEHDRGAPRVHVFRLHDRGRRRRDCGCCGGGLDRCELTHVCLVIIIITVCIIIIIVIISIIIQFGIQGT